VYIDILTLFPQYFEPLNLSLLGQAQAAGKISITVHNLRDWGRGVHRNVDDTPYGGGPGMLLRVDVMDTALRAVLTNIYGTESGRAADNRLAIVVLSAAGKRFVQATAHQFAQNLEHLVILCPRFEGFDQRIIDLYRRDGFSIDEYSVGDFVTFGAEAPALAMIEAIARLVPGVIGNQSSLESESFGKSGLEYPQYTKPNPYRGFAVPPVLVEGNHKLIAEFRSLAAQTKTQTNRPDLLTPPENSP
jgi:tRNA (guanine37-N1)-methyltransferase